MEEVHGDLLLGAADVLHLGDQRVLPQVHGLLQLLEGVADLHHRLVLALRQLLGDLVDQIHRGRQLGDPEDQRED